MEYDIVTNNVLFYRPIAVNNAHISEKTKIMSQ